MITLLQGHVLDILATLPAKSVHCVVTSPPYYRLRRYTGDGVDWPDGWHGQLGHEVIPDQFIGHLMVAEVTHIYVWRLNPALRGQPCHLLVTWRGHGPHNVLVEFAGGLRVVCPMRCLRRIR